MLVLSPDPYSSVGELRVDLVTFECFLVPCKLMQHSYFCISPSDCTGRKATLYKVSSLGLMLAHQNAALRFCISMCSNVQLAHD